MIRSGIVLAALALVMNVAPGTAAAEDESLVPAEEIVKQLGPVRRPRAHLPMRSASGPRPDPATHQCDPGAVAARAQRTGNDLARTLRSLVVEGAPSIDLTVGFDFDAETLTAAGRSQLDELARALGDPSIARWEFVVIGHTDAKGTPEYNDRLSCGRALSARRYLHEQHGIALERLVPLGFGASQLKRPGAPYDAANRRVEIRRLDAAAAPAG